MEETQTEETKVEQAAPVEVEPVGINETMEVIKGLDLVADIAAAVFANGKIDGGDFLVVAAKLKELDVIVDAIQDADEIGEEIKDLDEAEVMQLGVAAYSLVKKVVEAVKKNKELK